MIKFFRKIRYRLMSENKTTRYVKYAIGEIVLVMIGILLALQVSNWNDKRIAQKNEVKILSQLNQDLKVNLQELTQIFKTLVDSNREGLKFLTHLNSGKTYHDSIPTWINNYGTHNIFNNANTTYKNLENSEKSVISNDSLRIRITLMYELEFANVHTREKFLYEEHWPKFKEELYKNFKLGPMKESWLKGQFADITIPRNWNALKKNDDFKNAFMSLYNSRLIRIQWLGETLKKLEVLIKDVNKEIEELK